MNVYVWYVVIYGTEKSQKIKKRVLSITKLRAVY